MTHRIVHWEIAGPDSSKLSSFYRELFGWSTSTMPGMDTYHMTDAEETGVGGAIGQGNEEMAAYVTLYVQVDSVDAALAAAEGNGGATVQPRTVIPGVVSFGLFSDPAGNVIGVVEADTPPAG